MYFSGEKEIYNFYQVFKGVCGPQITKISCPKVETLCGTPETNVTLYVHYTSTKKKWRGRRFKKKYPPKKRNIAMCGITINNRKDSRKIQESEYLWQKMKAHWLVIDRGFKDIGNVSFSNWLFGGTVLQMLIYLLFFTVHNVTYTL